MPSTDDLALLSYMAYTPSRLNALPTGDWQEIPELQRNEPAGMRASVFVNSAGEVVIAYRGTDDSSVREMFTDFARGNTPAAVGHHLEECP